MSRRLLNRERYRNAMPIFRYFVCCYLLPKIKLKRSIDLMSRGWGFFNIAAQEFVWWSSMAYMVEQRGLYGGGGV